MRTFSEHCHDDMNWCVLPHCSHSHISCSSSLHIHMNAISSQQSIPSNRVCYCLSSQIYDTIRCSSTYVNKVEKSYNKQDPQSQITRKKPPSQFEKLMCINICAYMSI